MFRYHKATTIREWQRYATKTLEKQFPNWLVFTKTFKMSDISSHSGLFKTRTVLLLHLTVTHLIHYVVLCRTTLLYLCVL